MNDSKISTRYAKALFSYVKEKNLFDTINTDIEVLISAFKEVENLEQLMFCPTIKTSVKKSLIDRIFSDNVSKEFLSFLTLVVNNKREDSLLNIARNYKSLYKEYAGITSVVITGAKEISKSQIDKISSVVEAKLNTKIEVQSNVNPDLIGGFVLRIDDKQYDASIANKLRMIKKQLKAVNIN